jgi:copper chaperone CopZ
MKNLLPLKAIIMIAAIAILVSCNSTGKKSEKNSDNLKVSAIEVSITGMTCSGCEQKIQTSVAKIEGIKSVVASAVSGKAIVEFNPDGADTAMIRKAITESGYGVTGFRIATLTDSIK